MKNIIISKTEGEKILHSNNLGFLSMVDVKYPYTIPITYGYDNGRIIFHCNLKGKKIDILRKNKNVSFLVAKQFGHFVPHPQGAKCHAHSESVLCYGKVRIIDNLEERREILSIFNKCIVENAREILIDEVKGCMAIVIIIEEMTVRIEKDSQCQYFKYGKI